MKIRVGVFDDNKTRREGLEMMLNLTESIECVGSWPDCKDVINSVATTKPEVILMDIEMPNVNGIEGLILIKKFYPNIKVLMQTVFEDDEKIFACITAGADGYILKKTPPHELIRGIVEVTEGGAPMTPSVAKQVLRLFNHGLKQNNSKVFNLTEREQEILTLLVKGLSYKMIADKCSISITTVNTHVRHIYEKLQVHSVAAAVATAIDQKIV